MLDTARGDRFHCPAYGRCDPEALKKLTPEISRLSDTAVVFRRNHTQGTSTPTSLPRILYSRYFAPPLRVIRSKYPEENPVDLFRRLDDEAVSIPAALRASGYHSALITTHPWLTPESDFAQQFSEYEFIAPRRPAMGAAAEFAVDAALAWLENNDDRDFFLWLHFMDPHQPFRDGIYNKSIHYLDFHLGRIFSYLREKGIYDDTLIVIASDHGERLYGVNKKSGHGGPPDGEVNHVPLIISYPNRLEPRIDMGLTENTDIMPTVLELLEVPLPAQKTMDGISLVEPKRTDRKEAVADQVIVAERFKALYTGSFDASDQSAGQVEGELFDLRQDPRERNDVRAQHPEVWANLLEKFRTRLGAPYQRYMNAERNTALEQPFAVGAADFGLSLPEKQLAAHGWTHDRTWASALLSGKETASPLGIRISVPSQRYWVSVLGGGRFFITIDEKTYPVQAAESSWTELGLIDVKQNAFRARIRPNRGSVGLQLFGFRPEDSRVPSAAERESEEALRALGYIQ